MSTNKIIQALGSAAGAAGGAALNVEDVFSTYLYEGNGSTQTITNGIDLSGEGGLVWNKRRDGTQSNGLFDTERGTNYTLLSNSAAASQTIANSLTSFNSNGFTLGGAFNASGFDAVTWTFRKAPKFFDVVTYTGNGTTNRQISHNLGSAPGCIIVKRTNGLKDWAVYHRGKGNTHYGTLNTNEAFYDNATWWQDTDPTSTNFTVGNSAFVNANGDTYVAYLFAHNNGDGEFGPTGDQDIIKCGSYNDTSSQDINLGFEPQWILVKDIDATDGNWGIMDTMRGWLAPDGNHQYVIANGAQNEQTTSWVSPTSTGFKTPGFGNNYIYIAIRRGPMGIPESATDVFTPVLATSSGDYTAEAGFPVDLNWYARRSVADGGFTWDRLRGANYLKTNSTGAETAYSAASFDSMTAFYLDGLTGNFSDYINYNWKRAPNFFDVVAYTGNGTAGRTVSHNLGVAPEMIWVKQRNAAASWRVYHSAIGNTGGLTLNLTNAAFTLSTIWNNTSPTATDFTLGTYGEVNTSGNTYIAYLFASLDGVSKVGSFSHTNGTDTNVDCGFSSGARFVLVKRTDSAQGWVIVDSARGIVAGADPYLFLNVTDAEQSFDLIDPLSSGFTAVGNGWSTGSYIFYAIA